MYEKTTAGVRVRVRPEYLEDHSDPSQGRYFWAYHVEIANEGDCAVQLLSRYWRITDARGRVEEVRGPGVVGKQPVLQPGRTLLLFQRRAAADRLRLHGRAVPDGARGRRRVRDRHSGLLARQPLVAGVDPLSGGAFP